MNINNEYVSATVKLDKYKLIISGNKKTNKDLYVYAANPPDTLGNYSGTALPFASVDIAFENTCNFKKITTNSFEFTFKYPNTFYSLPDGNIKMPSAIYFSTDGFLSNNNVKFLLEDTCPIKSLTSRNVLNKPEFYNDKYNDLPIGNNLTNMINLANYKIINNKG